MIDHIGLRVADLPASIRFYTALLGALGQVPGPQGADYAGFGPRDAPAFWLHGGARSDGGGCHVAFAAADRDAVRRFHAAGLAAGGHDNGAPGPRPDYGPTYYAAFIVDADGNNLEAVCHR